VDDKALLSIDSVEQQTVAMQCLSTHVPTMEAKMFSVWSVRWLYHEYETRSENSSDNGEVSGSSPVRSSSGSKKCYKIVK
jgi:hypothetical protein